MFSTYTVLIGDIVIALASFVLGALVTRKNLPLVEKVVADAKAVEAKVSPVVDPVVASVEAKVEAVAAPVVNPIEAAVEAMKATALK